MALAYADSATDRAMVLVWLLAYGLTSSQRALYDALLYRVEDLVQPVAGDRVQPVGKLVMSSENTVTCDEPAAWETAMASGELATPDVVAVTVTVALRAAPVLAAAVMVKLPGVLPLAADTVSQVWLEDTV